MADPVVNIRVEYTDGEFKDFELGKVTVIKKGGRAGVEMHLDKMQDGRHLLICSDNLWPDGKLLKTLTVVREPEVRA